MKAIWKITLREFKIIASKRSYFIILLVFPPILFLLYSFIYNSQGLKNIPIAVWDEDKTELSRFLIRQYQSSPMVTIVASLNSATDIENLARKNEIHGAVHIPKNFETNLKSFNGSTVTFYRNTSNLIFGSMLYKAFAQVTLTINAGILLERFKATGVEPETAMNLANPIRVHVNSLYNPTYNYQNYLVPGLMTVGFQMMLIMIAVLIINSEWENNTYNELLQMSKGSTITLLMGKTLPHFIIGLINVVLMFGVFYAVFNIPINADVVPLVVLFSLLILACLAIGIMVSVIFKEALMASDLALFYTSPAFVFSGFTFPKWAMPWYDQFYASLMPYTPFLMGFFKVYQMDAGWNSLLPNLIHLGWFILIPYSIAFAVLKIKNTKILKLQNEH